MGHKYMSYSRDAGGYITRNNTIVIVNDIKDYSLRESLFGWPDGYVFWMLMADGSANGIAPMTKRVLSEIKHYAAIDGSKPNKNNSAKSCT